MTTLVTKTYAVIGIEGLNVRGMVRNHHLARAVSDGGFHEFRRQIEYKGGCMVKQEEVEALKEAA